MLELAFEREVIKVSNPFGLQGYLFNYSSFMHYTLLIVFQLISKYILFINK